MADVRATRISVHRAAAADRLCKAGRGRGAGAEGDGYLNHEIHTHPLMALPRRLESASQFSTRKPATRENSSTLAVTRMYSAANA